MRLRRGWGVAGASIHLSKRPPVIRWLATSITDFFNTAVETLKPHLSPLITLGSLSFAIYKWVLYRDSVLFLRLKDLVAKTISTLMIGRSDLLALVCRPAPGQTTTAPLFIEDNLRSLMERRYWWRILSRRDPVTRVDKQLSKSLTQIDKQLEWTELRLKLFREQRATVHLIKGAIASARSERANNAQGWWKTNNAALAHFRDALGVPGNERDLDALEYKAHQLRKLGHLEGAKTCYEEIETCATSMESSRRKDLLLSRALRYQAEICRLQNPPALGVANNLFTAALNVLAPHTPLVDRELLEQAEINELQGCVRFGLNFNNVADQSLSDAQSDYQRILDTFEEAHRHRMKRIMRWIKRLFRDDGTEEILKSAAAGVARVTAARQDGSCKI